MMIAKPGEETNQAPKLTKKLQTFQSQKYPKKSGQLGLNELDSENRSEKVFRPRNFASCQFASPKSSDDDENAEIII